MTISPYYLLSPLPEGLEGLAQLGLDLRRSWSHTADSLWEWIDPEVWALTRNPWLIVQTVCETHLKALVADPDFARMVNQL